jgi:hypothetical protein
VLNNPFSRHQLWFLALILLLLVVHFFSRNVVFEPQLDKSWQSRSDVALPAPWTVPAELLATYQQLQQAGPASSSAAAAQTKFDGAALAEFYVTLFGIYQKSGQMTVIAQFQHQADNASEIKYLQLNNEYKGVRLEYADAKEAVFRLGEQTVKLKLFKANLPTNPVQRP